jgi:4-hydroxy-tetrahydrodipicolinate reductase
LVARDLDPAWELRDTGWHVVVEGDAPLDIEVHFARENHGAISPGYNARIAVNAVPAVCDATPRIRTTNELRIVPIFR